MNGELRLLTAALVLCVAAASNAAAAAPKCTPAKVAELHVDMEGLAPLVDAEVDGQPARFLLDTGAFFSMVTARAAAKFRLKPVGLPLDYSVRDVVGSVRVTAGRAAQFRLGQAAVADVDFFIEAGSYGSADGLLGQNILGRFDVEYDFANGVARLYEPGACGGLPLAYWAQDGAYSVVPIAPISPTHPHIVAEARVNGRPVKALFDTGSSISFLQRDAALRAGASPHGQGARPAGALRGAGSKAIETYLVPFATVTIGEETIRGARLRVARSGHVRADMLLGADFFLSHRVLVSPGQRKLYFTYNGGPVFRLEDDADEAARVDASPHGGGAAEPLDDAGALARRAAASTGRRDYARAIADLDRAIALKPGDPKLHLDRAAAHIGVKDEDKARKDLDEAIQLEPDLADALVLRGHLRLKAKDMAGADADFAAALKREGGRATRRLWIASLYTNADRFEDAVAQIDAWIVENPQSEDLAVALNARCWARALWGRDLGKALADCDQALRRGMRISAVYDSRGMVRLRRGEFDAAIADYDRALKLQPRAAWSLYGRGLARLKRGDARAGRADIQAALALRPEIAEQSGRWGLTEAAIVVAGAP